MMKRPWKNLVIPALAVCFALSIQAKADIILGMQDETAPWLGFMNVFDLPGDGGAFVFGSSWGVSDLVSTFEAAPDPTVTLSPNTIGDPDPFWYIGGGMPGAPGNKTMEANLYIEETGPLAGDTIIFEGFVTAFSLTSAHTASVFIRDFAPDYSSSVDTFVPITGTGAFSASLATIADPLRHVQYGFRMVGENVWVTDTGPFGSLTLSAVPEPGSLTLLGLGAIALGMVRRRRAC